MSDKDINEFLTEYLLHAKINALKSQIHLHNILYKIPIRTSRRTRCFSHIEQHIDDV